MASALNDHESAILGVDIERTKKYEMFDNLVWF